MTLGSFGSSNFKIAKNPTPNIANISLFPVKNMLTYEVALERFSDVFEDTLSIKLRCYGKVSPKRYCKGNGTDDQGYGSDDYDE